MIDLAFAALLHKCTPSYVPVENMEKIISAESSRRSHAIGYKLIRKDGKVFHLDNQPKDKAEAIKWATWFEKNGFYYDASIGQINSRNFRKYGLTVESAFDTCENIRVSAEIFYECFSRASKIYSSPQYALRAALSCYNSGNFRTGFSTGYVDKVVNSGKNK